MTKEERDEKKRSRLAEKSAAAARFPEVRFHISRSNFLTKDYGQIILNEGDYQFITLRKPKCAEWHADHGFPEVEVMSGDLGADMPAFAALIRGLILRYNALVKDANAEAVAVPRMEPLAMIDIPDPPETYQHDGTRTD